MSGIVETDKHEANVNFPSFVTKEDGSYIIPAGTPIVQAIPFKRGFDKKPTVRAFTNDELLKRNLNQRRHAAMPSFYRDLNGIGNEHLQNYRLYKNRKYIRRCVFARIKRIPN